MTLSVFVVLDYLSRLRVECWALAQGILYGGGLRQISTPPFLPCGREQFDVIIMVKQACILVLIRSRPLVADT